jgi:hypothetical protein
MVKRNSKLTSSNQKFKPIKLSVKLNEMNGGTWSCEKHQSMGFTDLGVCGECYEERYAQRLASLHDEIICELKYKY